MLAAICKTRMQGSTGEPGAEQKNDVTQSADSMKLLLKGLWLSGLRLGEALNLTWVQWSEGIRVHVDEDGDVCLMIDGSCES